jgi:hypothetical protein
MMEDEMAKAETNTPVPTEDAEATTIKHPEITVSLVVRPGTEFQVWAKVANAMRKAKVPAAEVCKFMQEASAGDHTTLPATVMKWVVVK